MDPINLHFDIRDIFRAPRLALSGKKIWIFLYANLIGYVLYFALSYLAIGFTGQLMSSAWSAYGLFPVLCNASLPWYSTITYWVGVILWFWAISFACTAVARITYKQLKGDEFFSSGDARAFVKKHWHPVIFTSISLALIVTFFVVLAVIAALLGKIPFVGEFFFVLPYFIYFFGAVFTIYTGIVFIMSLIYTPAIVASYEEDTMGAVFQSYSIAWSQPWRFVLFHLTLLPLAGISVYVMKLFWGLGFKFIYFVFGQEWLMGEKLTRIMGWAAEMVNPSNWCSPNLSSVYCNTCDGWFDIPTYTSTMVLSGTELVAAIVLSIFLFVLMFSIFSYGLSILSVGEVLMFTIYKKKSNDENLLEQKDEDELEDEDNDSESMDDAEEDATSPADETDTE